MFTITCSFGEIIDKATILEIKLAKATGTQKVNIQTEYDGLKSHLKPVLDPGKMPVFNKMVDELRRINQTLWTLEDTIREKSKSQAFDQSYIQVAEAIHKTNDDRYQTKRSLNSLVGSTIVEEKIYSDENPFYIRARQAFEKGNYETSLRLFERLCEKFKDGKPDVFLCSLLSSYDTNVAFLGIENKYNDLMDKIIPRVRDYVPDEAHCRHILMNHGMNLMRRKEYGQATEFLRFMNAVTAPNILPETMSYFPVGSVDKTLLIYMGGGIGDKIMFSRFVPRICQTQSMNRIILLADDNLMWIFSQVFKESNLMVIPFSKREMLKFDYHTNIHMLPHWLGLEYGDIYHVNYLQELTYNTPVAFTKKAVLINWHGNYANSLERLNRGISLDLLVPLLAIKDIQWVSTQKEFTAEEEAILKRYNVLNMGPHVDREGHAYKDTLAIMKKCELVISTDTSFVHVAGTANIPCWTLLTKGCEWRWTYDMRTRWYPDMQLFRQKIAGSWAPVITEVKQKLTGKH